MKNSNSNFLLLFFFFVKICPDDDSRTSVETLVFPLISFFSSDNHLLLKITKVPFVKQMKKQVMPAHLRKIKQCGIVEFY